MFSQSAPIDRSLEEGTITEVDVIRLMCKVKTMSGHSLTSVQWLQPSGGASRGGDRVIPFIGDRVIIHSGLGYPIIIGFLPRLQSATNAFPTSIDSGNLIVDTGNFSDSGKLILSDQNAPSDMLNGDRVISSPGGGLFALLRGGSLLFKSSKLAQIFISKFDDLVRVVSRNWQHFTDVSSDVIQNVKGRVYRYIGYAKSSADGKVEAYSYHQYIGDVALAEAAKTDYKNLDTLPVVSDIIFKEQVTNPNGGTSSELYKRELHLDGKQTIVVNNNGIFTKIESTNGEIQITYNDTNIIKVNASEISLKKGGDQKSVIISDSSIISTFDDAVHTLDSTGVSSTFSGHFVKVTSSGVSLG